MFVRIRAEQRNCSKSLSAWAPAVENKFKELFEDGEKEESRSILV